VKKYEGLFVLNTAGREENVKDIIDKISEEITRLGGTIETVQKMDKRPFARVTKKHLSSGFYVNFIFEIKPESIAPLRNRFALSEDVMRVLFTIAPVVVKPTAQPVVTQ
jgi:ribosomal protein S6